MATLPRYGGPQVAPTNIPNVRISDAPAQDIRQGGQAISQGIGAFADVAGQMAQREREKADTAAQMEVENALAQLENETLHDPETGMLNLRGKDAIGADQKFGETWQRRQAEIVSRAPSSVRAWAVQQAERRRNSAQVNLMRHSVQEGNKYYGQQARGLMENATHTATLNYRDPNRVEEEAARSVLAADRIADLEGADDITRGNLRTAAASGVYRAVIERHMAENPDAAAVELERVRGRLTGEDVTRLESTLRPVLIDAGADAWLSAQLAGRQESAGTVPVQGAAKSLAEAETVARQSVGRTLGLESVAGEKNPRSSAEGVGQFIDETWFGMLAKNRPEMLNGFTPRQLMSMKKDDPRRQAVVARKRDAALSRQMTEQYAVENARGLYESGLPVTPQTVYMAHHFGLGGARALLRSAPDTPVSQVLKPADIAANPYLKGKTVGELVATHAKRAGEAPAAAANASPAAPAAAAPARTADGRTDWAELERRAQELPNRLLRERAVERIRSSAAMEQRQIAEAERQRDERIVAAINANPNAPLARVLSPADYASVANAGKLPAMDNYRRQMAEGGLIQDDVQLVDQLMRLAETDPKAFLATNVAAVADRLSTPTLSRLRKMQEDGRKDPAKAQDWATGAQRLDGIFRAVGVGREADAKGTGSDEKNAARARHRGELRLMWQLAVEEYVKGTGKMPVGAAADELAEKTALRYITKRQSDNTTRMERNTKRLEEGLPLELESRDAYRLTPEGRAALERASVVGWYRGKYGQDPPPGYVESFMRKAGESK